VNIHAIEKHLHALIQPVVKGWFKSACADPFQQFFLWYLPQAEQVQIATEKPGETWELASNYRISPAWTIEQAQAQCFKSLWSVPILKPETTEV
jgi:hypothetical protein